MNKPIRIQRSRQHKQFSPNGLPIVYVGRPSEYGNPFIVNQEMPLDILHELGYEVEGILEDREAGGVLCNSVGEALKYFEKWVNHNKYLKNKVKAELKGKNLSCWCKIGEPCHADILLKLANE